MQQSVFDLNKKFFPQENQMPRQVIILGSTGSVGSQAFDLCINNPKEFKVKALVSHGNVDELLKQVIAAEPEYVVLSEESSAKRLQQSLTNSKTKILFGEQAKKDVIADGYDVAITAVPGIKGLSLTLDAIKYSKIVAFANKETVIYAGEMMLELAEKHQTCIIPIDSEHNAIFQILDGLNREKVGKIILTASGGPLLNYNYAQIKEASPEEVLKHPTWKMGRKISVDSATLFNKALEVIEASYLFGFPLDKIEAVIHPESIVHGMVRLHDGSLIMHAGARDMRLPISYALSWPNKGPFIDNLNLCEVGSLNFSDIDHERFPMFQLAINAAKSGYVSRIAMNYANEVAVQMFLDRKIRFLEMYEIVKEILEKIHNIEFELQANDHCKVVQMICDHVDGLFLRNF